MGVFGYALDLAVLRRMSGQSQIAVIILTIALGFVLRFAAGRVREGNTSASYAVSVSRDAEEIFSTEVTLVRVDGTGRKLSLPKTGGSDSLPDA